MTMSVSRVVCLLAIFSAVARAEPPTVRVVDQAGTGASVQLPMVPVPGRVQASVGDTEIREAGVTLRLPGQTSSFSRVQQDRPGFAATFMVRSGERTAEVGVVIDRAPTSRHAEITGRWATPSVMEIVDRFPNDWDFYLWLYALTEEAVQPKDSDQWVLWHVFNRVGASEEISAFVGPDTRVIAHVKRAGGGGQTVCMLRLFDVAGESRGSITARFAGEVHAEELREHLMRFATLVVIEPRKHNPKPATQPARD